MHYCLHPCLQDKTLVNSPEDTGMVLMLPNPGVSGTSLYLINDSLDLMINDSPELMKIAKFDEDMDILIDTYMGSYAFSSPAP